MSLGTSIVLPAGISLIAAIFQVRMPLSGPSGKKARVGRRSGHKRGIAPQGHWPQGLSLGMEAIRSLDFGGGRYGRGRSSNSAQILAAADDLGVSRNAGRGRSVLERALAGRPRRVPADTTRLAAGSGSHTDSLRLLRMSSARTPLAPRFPRLGTTRSPSVRQSRSGTARWRRPRRLLVIRFTKLRFRS